MAILVKIYIILMRLIYALIKLFFPIRKKISFISRQGNQIPVDFELLINKLKESGSIEIIVSCKKVTDSVRSIIAYMPTMLKQMWHIATSKIVILDSYCVPVSVLNHKSELKIIQMWHAIGLLKKAGYASLGTKEGRNGKLAELLYMHRGYHYIVVGSEKCIEPMLQVFGYDKAGIWHQHKVETIVSPLPRVDLFRSEDYAFLVKKNILKQYSKLKYKKNILYAPTYRKSEDLLYKKTEELINAVDYNKYNLIIKGHPLSFLSMQKLKSRGNVNSQKMESVLIEENFSATDMAVVCDVCISDYSSLVFEFMVIDKPVYLYAFDFEAYQKDRGIFIDYQKEIPGKLYTDGIEIYKAIESGCFDMSQQKEFLNRYVNLTKNSNTDRIVDVIKSVM